MLDLIISAMAPMLLFFMPLIALVRKEKRQALDYIILIILLLPWRLSALLDDLNKLELAFSCRSLAIIFGFAYMYYVDRCNAHHRNDNKD